MEASSSSAAGSSAGAAGASSDAGSKEEQALLSLLAVLPGLSTEDADQKLAAHGWDVEAAVSAHFAAFDPAPAAPGRQHVPSVVAPTSGFENFFDKYPWPREPSALEREEMEQQRREVGPFVAMPD